MNRIAGCFTLVIMAMSVATASPGPAFGQGNTRQIPANAHAEPYGAGWKCDQGYSDRDGACTPIEVPANAYTTNSLYGRGWDCKRGFRENRGACLGFEIPANAYLNASGNGWKCLRGYQNSRKICTFIEIPENGFLNEASYGTGWSCERGFEQIDQTCKPLTLPANTHLDYSGNRWECDPPLRRQDNECIPRGR